MRVTVNGKTHNVDDNTINRMMKNFPCSKEQAIQIYIEDELWVDNDNTKEMQKAEKEQKEILRFIHGAISEKVVNKKMAGQATRGTGEKKVDTTKIDIITGLAEYLKTKYQNVTIENSGKLITFTHNNEPYKIDLTKTRVPKAK